LSSNQGSQDRLQPGLRERNLRNGATPPGLTLAQLATAKKLSVDRLRALGCRDAKGKDGNPEVRIPYPDPIGTPIAVHTRVALKGGRRFRWRRGDHATLYGLDRLAAIRAGGEALMVEGETDCWAGWEFELPVLGLPGKDTWRSEWADHFEGLQVFVWQEPGAEDMVDKIAADLPSARVLVAPPGIKDLSEAHLQGKALGQLIETLKRGARTAGELAAERREQRGARLRSEAADVLAADDPVELLEADIVASGYGGDTKAAMITAIAATGRVLEFRSGQILGHVLLKGTASSGKNTAERAGTRSIPPEVISRIDAGSPRVILYDKTDLRHGLLIFSEMDSMPSSKTEDESAPASAVRSLLQEGHLAYDVVVTNPQGIPEVVKIRRDGPTVLITTGIRRLPHQSDTRVFTVEMLDSQDQIRAALQAQARLEDLDSVPPPSAPLIAFQRLLQLQAPWRVRVPFAQVLADEIGRAPNAPRVLRDYSKLLSFTKAVAVLRHAHRHRDPDGRLVALLADYETVHELVNEIYSAEVSGVSVRVRETVEAVRNLIDKGNSTVRNRDVADVLEIHKSSASRRVREAMRGGWLVNAEEGKNRPALLKLGEVLPPDPGLPTAERLAEVMAEATLDEHHLAESRSVKQNVGRGERNRE
jgi:hypothetical protein